MPTYTLHLLGGPAHDTVLTLLGPPPKRLVERGAVYERVAPDLALWFGDYAGVET